MPKRGDIVLVVFPFTDLTGEKRRPALVVATSADHCVTLFITSRARGERKWHVSIYPTKTNGLVVPSIVRCNKIASFDVRVVQGKLGRASRDTMREVNTKLRRLFSL